MLLQVIKGKLVPSPLICMTKTNYMKQFFTVTLSTLFLLVACNNDKTQAKMENKNENAAQAEVKSLTDADKTAANLENLKKASPLTIEQLTNLLPDTVNQVRQRNYASNSMMGYNSVQAEYPFNKKSSLKITLNDCAGEEGSKFYESNYLQLMKANEENETEYTRAMDMDNKKAIEYYNKTLNQTIITYSVNDRLLVILQGNNMRPEDLRLLARQIEINFPK